MTEQAHHDQHAAGHHVTPIWVYLKTFLWLMALMAATVLAARLPYLIPGALDLPAGQQAALSWLNNVVAVSIACAKAALVVLFFMGVKYSTNLTKLFAVMGFVWFLLMFFIFADYATRRWEPVRGWAPVTKDAAIRGTAAPEERAGPR
jgi:cytochrome c oxidase subunit 4